jgi:hypothetical protein
MSLRPAFPQQVNEVVARTVAGGVVVLAAVAIAAQAPWLAVVLAVGFLLRVGWGSRLSPLALLASRVIVPRLGLAPRPVAGAPKRFAQLIGLMFSSAAVALFYAVSGTDTAGYAVLGALIAAATLESVFGICLGCRAFGGLMRLGVIAPEVCERCNDIWVDRTSPSPAASRP